MKIEPTLKSITGEQFNSRTANTAEKARLDARFLERRTLMPGFLIQTLASLAVHKSLFVTGLINGRKRENTMNKS